MTQYAAIIYSRDVDWTQPQYADVTAQYARSRRRPAPSSAEVPRSTPPRPPPPCGSRRKGGTTARPPTGPTPRPRRPSPASTCSSAPTSTRQCRSPRPSRAPGTGSSRCAPSSSSRCERRRLGGGSRSPPRTPTAPWPRSCGSRAVTSSPPSPAGPATSRSPRTPCRTRACARCRPGRATASPTTRSRGCAPRPAGCAVDLIRRESARGPKEALAFGSAHRGTVLPEEDPGPEVVDDDLLRLVFTCCHPSLAAGDPGGPGPAHPVRAEHRGGGPRPRRLRAHHGQAAHPGPPEDPAGRHPLPGAVGRTTCPSAGTPCSPRPT